MSLLDKASLIVTPNAYKASKLYSVIPSDGSGDMDVVRATTATRVNELGLIENVGLNVPRIDYTNGGCPSILVEPQRTNLLLRSEELNVSPWGTLGTITITPNNTVSPDGNLTADLVLGADSSSSVNQIIGGSTGVVYTNSFFIKNNNSTQSALTIRNSITAVDSRLNWSGSVLTSVTNIAGISTFKNYGNGWYRIISTYTSLETPQRPRISPTLSTNQSVYIWGAQLEVGSNVTSYIPTVASTVTRNADVISKTGISGLIGQTEGTVFVDAKLSVLNTSNQQILVISDGLSVNRIRILSASASRLRILYQLGGSTAYDFTYSENYINLNSVKIAFTYKSGDIKIYINGNLVNTSSNTYSISNPLIDLSILSNGIDKGLFNSVQLYKTALTDTELIALTTI